MMMETLWITRVRQTMIAKTKSIEHILSLSPDIEAAEDRFWDHVDKTTSDRCWEWLGGRNKGGYGVMYIGSTHLLAHRLMFYFARGIDPQHEFVCHTCDHPWCVNPHHLFLGSGADNMQDAWKKGHLGGSLSSKFHQN